MVFSQRREKETVKETPQESKIEQEEKPEEKDFTPKEILPGSKSAYDMKLAMNSEGLFSADVKIDITNISNETWSELKLYFIPNMFTANNSPEIEQHSTINIKSIRINNKEMKYTLEKDMVHIPLEEGVTPNKSVTFQVNYQFTLPKTGEKFTEIDGNYYLAHWYPMVPTYRNGWNKQPYFARGESYHTTFSNFKVEYDIPEEYTIVTTGDNSFPNGKKNIIQAKDVKEFYVGLMKKPQVVQRNIKNVNVRVFGINESEKLLEEILVTATDTLTYFYDKIGPYPHNQLDIILDGPGMEYPGVVTVGSTRSGNREIASVKRTVVHEIAHQWFYGLVNNDPYFHAWLDEGITSFATSLFLGDDGANNVRLYNSNTERMPSNLPLNDYGEAPTFIYIYGQSHVKLAEIFTQHGGEQKAEEFFKEYVRLYKYKEVDTAEFVRFMKYYLKVEDDSLFKDWVNYSPLSEA
jgi:Peptidase family M1 domain